jgi:hypothetical protein
MLDVIKSIIVYLTINCITIVVLVSIKELPIDEIMINVNKGFALKRIGIYSPNMVEQIAHTFISLDSFCGVQTTDAICQYTSSSTTTTNIMELVNIMTPRYARDISFKYRKQTVTKLIDKDLNRVLMQHEPSKLLLDTKSSVHFINDKVHYQNDDGKILSSVLSNDVNDSYTAILRFRPTAADTIIKQINSNRISFEQLSLSDLKFFLTIVFSNIDKSYKVTNIEESLRTFYQLVIAQSVYALRYCTLNRELFSSSKSCLVVSTLFKQNPINHPSTYLTYRLTPLPTVIDGDKYIYSDLPKIIGINFIAQTVVIWDDELYNNKCTFSPIAICNRKPISILISKSLCLYQLLSENDQVVNMCQVSRSKSKEEGALHIDDDLWLFYGKNHTQQCELYSNIDGLTETLSIEGEVIVSIPCHATITCPDLQLSAASCTGDQLIAPTTSIFDVPNRSPFIVAIKNMTQMLVENHHLQLKKSMRELIVGFTSKQSKLKEKLQEVGMYIVSLICGILVMAIIYIIRLIKYKLQKDISDLDSELLAIILRK